MGTFFDFSQLPSPTPTSSSRQHGASASSTIPSPTNTIVPLDPADDLQTPAKPSHEYERFKQQTGLPSNSVPGLTQQTNGGYQFSNSGTGLDEMSLMGPSSFLDAGWGSGLSMGADVNMELDLSMPGSDHAYFFPTGDASQDDFVDPSAISAQEETLANVRVWPGMHQQQAALAKAAQAQAQQQRQQQQVQQKQRASEQQQTRIQPSRRTGSHQPTDPQTEKTIARVVNQIRHNSTLSSQSDGMSPQGTLPHIARMKKEEEDMDEDERLLASEEGKKLSSKERRQLRNKVSARAFRSRRKEYIGQLEGEVAMKNNECNELRLQNRALMEENARSRAFIERLLRHQAFTPFLEELSRDESLDVKPAQVSSSVPTPTPAPNRKDLNPYPSQQFQGIPQAENPQIGMALIPETQLDLSMLNLNNNWAMPSMGFNFQQPQVYSVMELPEGPSAPIDVDLLSGKGDDSFMSQISTVDEVKPDYPVIESPIEREETVEATTTEVDDYDDNPDFALYVNSPAPVEASFSAPVEESERLFGDANPEKVFAHFELFVSDEAESQRLMERFEKMCALVEPVFQRIQAMTSHLDS